MSMIMQIYFKNIIWSPSMCKYHKNHKPYDSCESFLKKGIVIMCTTILMIDEKNIKFFKCLLRDMLSNI